MRSFKYTLKERQRPAHDSTRCRLRSLCGAPHVEVAVSLKRKKEQNAPREYLFSGHAARSVVRIRHAREKEHHAPIPAGPPRRFLTTLEGVALGAAARCPVARLHGFPRGFVPFFSTHFCELLRARPR